MAEYPRTFRSSPWVFAILLIALMISVTGTMHFSSQRGSTIGTFAFGVLTAVFAIGMAEAFTARVVLASEFLDIVSNFRRKRILRTAKAKALAFRVLADRLEHGEDIAEIHGVSAVHG